MTAVRVIREIRSFVVRNYPTKTNKTMRKTFKFLLLSALGCLAGTSAWSQTTQIGTPEQLKAISDMSGSYELTADIDMKDQGWTSLENFSGTFDGRGFTIKNLGVALINTSADGATIKNLTIKSDEALTLTYSNFAPFVRTCQGNLSIENCVNQTAVARSNARRLGGFVGQATCSGKNITITNCRNEAEIFIRSAETAGFIGHDYGNKVTISNSLNLAKIWSDEDYAIAGFIGETANNGTYNFVNCGNTGTIICVDWISSEACAFIGRARGNITLTNCWNSGQTMSWTYVEDEAQGWGTGVVVNNPLVKGGLGTFINCYDVYNGVNGITQITEDFVTSGALCYLLNGDQTTLSFFQTLGEDPYPVLDAAHKQVFQVGSYHCDGMTPKGESGYSNTPGSSTVDPHTLEHGICTVCHHVDLSFTEAVDGVYQIGTADQLRWFADAINYRGIANNSSAVLTADIDLGFEPFSPIGLHADQDSEHRFVVDYRGTLDGQGHIIRKLTINDEYFHEAGLVSRLHGSIRNLGIEDADVTTNNEWGRAAVFAGQMEGGSIINCFAVGNLTINASDPVNDDFHAGIYASGSGQVRNCYTTYEKISGNAQATQANCYSLAELPGIQEEMTDGALCYKLNGNSFLNAVYFQTLGEDAYPVLDATHGIVYTVEEGSYLSVTESNYAEFRTNIMDSERAFCDEVVAHQGTIDAYLAEIQTWESAETLADFLAAYTEGLEVKATVGASQKVYQGYIDACAAVEAQLAGNTTQNVFRPALETYLEKENEVEPGDDYPNGSYAYVVNHHVLTNEQVAEEIEFVNMLLNRFLSSDPDAGSDLTVLLNNPTFGQSFDGWTVSGQAEMYVNTGNAMPVARGRNGVFTVSQTVRGIPNGIYMVKMNGFSTANNDVLAKVHTAELFANGHANLLMVPNENMVNADEAQDGVNCSLSNDEYVYDETNGEYCYAPKDFLGAAIAFKADRYENYTAVEVTDGTLSLGVRALDYNVSNWTPFSDAHLYYLGTADEANTMLTDVLQSYAGRAATICALENGYETEYETNISAQLRESLQAAIEEAEEAATGAKKMELIGRFTELFAQVHDCRKAYFTLSKAIAAFETTTFALGQAGVITEEEEAELFMRSSDAWEDCAGGTLTAEEALAMAEKIEADIPAPATDENGNYLLSSPKDFALFAVLVGVKPDASALVQNDIDLTELTKFQPVGTEASRFAGTFDGQGHTITYNYDTDIKYSGFFASVEGATIRNLNLKGTAITTQQHYGGLIGQSYGTVLIENVTVSMDITGNLNTTTGIGGMIGYNLGHTTFNNCATHGTLGNNPQSIWYCAFVGWGEVGSMVEINNCYTTMCFSEGMDTDRSSTFMRSNGQFKLNNCYYLHEIGPAQGTKYTEEELQNGALCYKLNQGAEANVFFQTLDEDAYPVLDATHGTVYSVGRFKCDGVTPEEGSEVGYSNVQGDRIIAPHTFVDGICSVCGAYDPELIVDGVYQIGTAEKLLAFAKLKNAATLKAALTADIDMTEKGWTSMENFAGSFDGQGHTLKNLGVALFNTTADGAVIKNLTIASDEALTLTYSNFAPFVRTCQGNLTIDNCVNQTAVARSNARRIGGFVGQATCSGKTITISNSRNEAEIFIRSAETAGFIGHDYGNTVTISKSLNLAKIWSDEDYAIGGFIGESNGNGTYTIENCGNTGTIICRDDFPGEACAFIGRARGTITLTNCWNSGETMQWTYDEEDTENWGTGTVANNPLTQNGTGTFTNCYDVFNGETEGVTQIEAEDVASGALTYQLNEGAAQTIFFQKLGDDLYPVFDPAHMTVLKADDGTYYNVETAIREISADADKTVIYDLSGRRVEKMVKGIYIVNGKKVLK